MALQKKCGEGNNLIRRRVRVVSTPRPGLVPARDRRQPLPKQRDSVGRKLGIAGDNHQTFDPRLSDREAVERVAMVPGKTAHRSDMRRFNAEQRQAAVRHRLRKQFVIRFGRIEFLKRRFYCNLHSVARPRDRYRVFNGPATPGVSSLHRRRCSCIASQHFQPGRLAPQGIDRFFHARVGLVSF